MKNHAEVLAKWAPDLALKLGRSVEEILKDGIALHDFSPYQKVKINFDDGSFAEFRYAFACIRKAESQLAVFTEHCGYLEFWLRLGMEVTEVTEVHYYHE